MRKNRCFGVRCCHAFAGERTIEAQPFGKLRGAIRVGAACLVLLLCSPCALYGQESGTADPPESVWLRLGPLALAPTIALTNLGWDSNVFQRPVDADPVGDFTATIAPELQGWLRLGRARASFRGALNYAYFRDYPSERSTDTAYGGRLELPQARVGPYVSARWIDARQRFGFEIDERTRRKEQTVVGGVVLRMAGRTQIDVAGRRSRLDFTRTDTLLDPLVSDFYDYTSHGLTLTVRRDLTPLTAVTVVVDGYQDRFDIFPQRDSNAFGVSSGFEFKPLALISGRALVGWTRVNVIEAGGSLFSGFVTSVDLGYTLLGATRFGIQAERGLSYSAIRGQHAFLLEQVKLSVLHRLDGNWDIGGRVGWYRSTYGLFLNLLPETDVPLEKNHENVADYGGALGYRLGPDTRIAFDVIRFHRRSSVAVGREYKVTRAGMSIVYRF